MHHLSRSSRPHTHIFLKYNLSSHTIYKYLNICFCRRLSLSLSRFIAPCAYDNSVLPQAKLLAIDGGNVIGSIAFTMPFPHTCVQHFQTVSVLTTIKQRTVLASLPNFGSHTTHILSIVAQPNGNLFVFLAGARNQFGTTQCGQL